MTVVLRFWEIENDYHTQLATRIVAITLSFKQKVIYMVEDGNNEREVLTVSSPEEIFQKAKIDYTHIVTSFSDPLLNFDYKFPVTPYDYLKFARLDFKDGQERGLINALSNVKRCIDCLIETALKSLGVDPHNVPSTALKFCDETLPDDEKNLMPLSLRLFCALGLAPSFLISEIRLLRNKVEHEYELPKPDDVRRAIEVAELLLNNISAKEASPTVEITDTKRYKKKGGLGGIWFRSEIEKGKENQYLFSLRVPVRDTHGWLEYYFKGDELILFFLLKMTFIPWHDGTLLEETIKLMLQNAGIRTPKEHINIVEFA